MATSFYKKATTEIASVDSLTEDRRVTIQFLSKLKFEVETTLEKEPITPEDNVALAAAKIDEHRALIPDIPDSPFQPIILDKIQTLTDVLITNGSDILTSLKSGVKGVIDLQLKNGGKGILTNSLPSDFLEAKLCSLVLPAKEDVCENIKVLRGLTSDIAYGLDSVNEKVSSLETKLEETNDLNPELLAHLYNDGDRYAKVLKKKQQTLE